MNTFVYMLVLAVVVMVSIQTHNVQGQSYHFSNGWNPGKRSMQDSCHFRPEVQNLVFKLIEDEVYRMLSDSSCLGGESALRNLLKKDLPYSVPITDRK
nr:gonadotropin releasing hormone [Pseudocardium sachalinense]